MAKSPAKPSVSKSKPIKYSLSYVRVSTKDQLDGSGIKRQEKAYQNWLRCNPDYENLDEYKDLGISGRGKNSKAGALNKIIENAEKGQISYGTCLVVESINRLSREAPKESLGLLLRIFKPVITKLWKTLQKKLGKKVEPPTRAEIQANKYREKKGLPPLKRK